MSDEAPEPGRVSRGKLKLTEIYIYIYIYIINGAVMVCACLLVAIN